jgi:hypothetical protein
MNSETLLEFYVIESKLDNLFLLDEAMKKRVVKNETQLH